jgi:hypothetical protein
MVDVKATETDLRSIMGIGIVPFINAHARVEIKQASTLAGFLPFAVPEPAPKKVRAIFVDEVTQKEIASRDLEPAGVDAEGHPVWEKPVTLPVKAESGQPASGTRIGVRFALSGQNSTQCGAPLVDCYDSESDGGIVFIQGWSDEGSGAQPASPKMRSATLNSTSCPDPYFSVITAECFVGLRAKVDFGTGDQDPTTNTTGVRAALRAVTPSGTVPLAYDHATRTWDTGEVIRVAPLAGPVPITLEWAEQKGKIDSKGDCRTTGQPFAGQNVCQGSFGVVQRTFSGSDVRSGPIAVAQIAQDGSAGANSLRRCDDTACEHELVVSMSLRDTLETAKDIDDPVVSLRTGDDNQTQALDCDPDVSLLEDEIVSGCGPAYAVNQGTTCPNKSSLWAAPQPWPCVALKTGERTPQVPAGLNRRIVGSATSDTCSHPDRPGFGPNRYKADFANWDPNDPRIVQLLLTPFGSFSGTGNDETVPVTNFATFYITGWSGQGSFNNPCSTSDVPADPLLRDDPTPTGKGNDSGYVVGHFINYVQVLNNGGGGTESCDFTALRTCVAVLTR